MTEEVLKKSFELLEILKYFQEAFLMLPRTEAGFCEHGSKPSLIYRPCTTFVQVTWAATRRMKYLLCQKEVETRE